MKRFSVLMAVATAAVAWGAGEQTCGGGLLATPCPADSFCAYNLGECGGPSVTALKAPEGLCKPKPEMCAQVIDMVCGCDGVTYNNACAANLKGVSVQAKGECTDKQGGVLGGNLLPKADTASTTDCGGPDAIQCAADYVCIYEAGNTCGEAGAFGHCETTKDMMCTVRVSRGGAGFPFLPHLINPPPFSSSQTIHRPSTSPCVGVMARRTATAAWPSSRTASRSRPRANATRAARAPWWWARWTRSRWTAPSPFLSKAPTE